jgi:hypothetical protein
MREDRRHTLIRAVLAIVGIVGALVVAWALVMSLLGSPLSEMAPEQRLGRVTFLTQVGLGSCLLGLGGFLAIRVGNRAGVLALAGYIVAQGLATGYLLGLLIMGVRGTLYVVARVLVNLLAYPLAIRTTQLFPRRLQAADAERIGEKTLLGRLSRPLFGLLGPRRVWTFSSTILLLFVVTRSELVFNVGQFAVITVAVLTMATNYRVADVEARRKIYWLLLGAEVLLVGRLAIIVGELTLDWLGVAPGASMRYLRAPAWTLANLGLIACLLTAVFYRGAVDPRLVVRRTAVYSLLTGATVFTFAAFENYVADLAAGFLGLPGGIVEAMGGAALALLLKPIHDFLAAVIKRVIPDVGASESAHSEAARLHGNGLSPDPSTVAPT